MSGLTSRRVRSLVDLASLIINLATMVRIDLEMMNFGLEVAIKQHAGCLRMALFSSMSRECEEEKGIVQCGENY